MEPVAHFGLGQATSVAEILVTWPDGTTQRLLDPAIDTLHRLQHPTLRGAASQIPSPAPSASSPAGVLDDADPDSTTSRSTTHAVDWNVLCCFEPMAVAVGDTVTFNFNSNHNVYIHPSGNCDTTDAILLGDNDAGSASYTFDSEETVTFACEVNGHCVAGQIVTISASGSTASRSTTRPVTRQVEMAMAL
eukprot:SAG31_NODE_5318_length_2613_cov_1.905330_4_plen_191_part_00